MLTGDRTSCQQQRERRPRPALKLWDSNENRETAVGVRATWNGVLLAESDDTVVVEGNHYFPASAVRTDYLRPSQTHTFCPWKGTASYYSIEIDGETNRDAAWYYPEPKDAATAVTDRNAFWRGVTVTTD
jgi:uncharacterized protein (DUF427 family)